MADTNGIVYSSSGEARIAAALDGYRIEPIMHFGSPENKKYIKEIWFGIVEGGAWSIDVSWRGGDTVKEVLAASWTSLGSISLNNPDPPVLYCGQNQRFHQLKWGTDAAGEKFAINWIDVFYELQGKY